MVEAEVVGDEVMSVVGGEEEWGKSRDWYLGEEWGEVKEKWMVG